MNSVTDLVIVPRRGSSINRLPYEIRRMIFEKSEWVTDVRSLALTCWAFYQLFQREERYIMRKILVNMIPSSIMSLAIARYEASQANWKPTLSGELPLGHDAYTNGVHAFCEKYINPHSSQQLLHSYNFTFKMAESVRDFHYLVVSFVVGTANYAVLHMRPPSATELTRLTEASYIYELISILFSFKDREQEDIFDANWRHFWLLFAPWQSRQVWCVEKGLNQYVSDLINRRSSLHHINVLCLGLRAWEVSLDDLKDQIAFRSTTPCLPPPNWNPRLTGSHDSSLWLPAVSDSTLSLDVSSVFQRYKDDDQTPRDVWLLVMGECIVGSGPFGMRLNSIARHFIDGVPRPYGHVELYYDVFWDWDRLELMYGELPTMETMYTALKDVVVDADSFIAGEQRFYRQWEGSNIGGA
ncbi:hypothetical protein F4779DRAFT_633523 [Xylariaceae sp. FL0662B]|nr:hypothetical protein F4779DRAFT_633523 [Xylariaceae sp. FL0662B]